MDKYNHKFIESKWQTYWEMHKLYASKVDFQKPKYYILDMFPYPSGAGLHVGHVTGYTATDIVARYKRQMGFNVLHPMGWDSFGLPAEQYAIRTGTHPELTTKKNINTYKRQLKSVGFSYDWDREIATSDPSYYKWTQWIFSILYKKGLAYEAHMLVNYCPALGTVLANEEVEEGRSKEGGYPIVRRPLKQWMLKITAYAEQLIEDLQLLDWPDHLKKLQINWIGKSSGAKILFKLERHDQVIEVFTTRPDTVFGVSFIAIAPEHPLVAILTQEAQKQAVSSYLELAASKSDLDRSDLSKEKTGVFTGSYALHPLTQTPVPVYVADFVIGGYGTGALMGVPAHDERDHEFALKYQLPITYVIETPVDHIGCFTGEGRMINSGKFSGLSSQEGKKEVIDALKLLGLGEDKISYKLRDWLFSRQRYWGEPFPILHFADGTKRVLDVDELPLCPPILEDFKPLDTGQSPLTKVDSWVHIIDEKTGKPALRETNTMPQWAGSCWYYLRFCDPHNDNQAWSPEAERYWMPVDLYVGGIEHAVLHLLYARFWHKVLFDAGYVSTKEPFQTLRNQGLVVARSYQKAGGAYLEPHDVYEKQGDYFDKNTHEKLRSQIDKMSKSKLNGITPDDVIQEYGADSLRLYEMFMGPFDKEKTWSTESMSGCYRFLQRFYNLVHSDKLKDEADEHSLRLCHKVVHAVQNDIETMSFNTAIAKLMEFLNEITAVQVCSKEGIKMVVQALYPFAPHISEELWAYLGGSQSLVHTPFPQVNQEFLISSRAKIVLQVGGKTRGFLELDKNLSQQEVLNAMKEDPTLGKYLTGTFKKVIYVQGKLINVLVDL
jgi:leucyl-tRNA synthetase